MTPNQYRREGAEAMREAAASVCDDYARPSPEYEKRVLYDEQIEQSVQSIRAIDVDEVLAGMAPTPDAVAGAWRDVLAERQRQISAEGWTPEHDDEHDEGDLAAAAGSYAINAACMLSPYDGVPHDELPDTWPPEWDVKWWKPSPDNPRRDLVKAGALILAEIERLDRAATATPTPDPVAQLVEAARAEADKAIRKFPQPNYVISKVAEEAGEVVKAAIHCAEGREKPENVRAEIVQAMAMLIRLYLEGDQVHGLPALAAMEASHD